MKKMKHRISALALLAITILSASCVKQKLETTYNSQEDKIDQYIEKNRIVSGDTLRVVYNEGAARLVTKEGEGPELTQNGNIAFYYAGYTFNGSFSASNLFVTNHQATAEQAGWNLTDADYQIYEISMNDAKLTQGLRDGLLGVKAGEECEIIFSGKYGFGNDVFGIIPANSAQLWKIWVVGVAND